MKKAPPPKKRRCYGRPFYLQLPGSGDLFFGFWLHDSRCASHLSLGMAFLQYRHGLVSLPPTPPETLSSSSSVSFMPAFGLPICRWCLPPVFSDYPSASYRSALLLSIFPDSCSYHNSGTVTRASHGPSRHAYPFSIIYARQAKYQHNFYMPVPLFPERV